MMYLTYARKTPRSKWLLMGRTDIPLHALAQACTLLRDIRNDHRQAGYNWHVRIVTSQNDTESIPDELSGRVDWIKAGFIPYAKMEQTPEQAIHNG